MIACFGDSITAGQPGQSYLGYLNPAKKYKNLGKGGDTLIGLSNRVDNFLLNSTCCDFTIEIGVNDILLPFLRNCSTSWKKAVDRLENQGSIPSSKIEDFMEVYERLIYKLSGKRLKVISIPCIGENLENELNQKVDEYNKAIKLLCDRNNIIFIDFNSFQKEILKNSKKVSDYLICRKYYTVILDALLTTYLPLSDWVSKKRNLLLTIDGVHLNKIGARGLASLIDKTFEGEKR